MIQKVDATMTIDQLLKIQINQLLRMFYGPENLDFLLLPDPMSSGNGLEIVLRVKVAVEYDDSEK